MTSPAENLANALGGTITGPSTIRVGTRTLRCYPTGGVYVLPERRKIGSWSDGTDALAAAFRDVVGERGAA